MQFPYQKWYKALQVRTSRRKFTDRTLEQKKLEHLRGTVEKLNEHFPGSRIIVLEHGFDEIRQNFVGSYGLVSGADSYAVILGKTREQNFQVQSGQAGEAFILDATAQDIDTCWLGGFFEPQKVKQDIHLAENEKILAVTPLGYARDRTSITEKILSKILKSKDRKPLQELCLGDSLEQAELWMETAFEAARLAPSTANLQPWKFAVEDDGITVLSTEDKERHGVSPYLDCGVALMHLIIGAGIEDVTVEVKYLEPPKVAYIKSAD